MTPKEILIAARDKIKDPSHFTREELARDQHGMSVHAMDKAAICWCSLGATRAVAGWRESSLTEARYILALHMNGNIAFFSDTRPHAKVLEAFDKAIEAAP